MRGTRRLSMSILRIALALMATATLTTASPAQDIGFAGKLISAEAMAGAPEGTRAYRILYWSTGLDGNPVEVSGVVIAPRGPPPPGGRPVVAWAHPTTGVVSPCAPSLARVFFASIQGLRAMLDRGYVVAATDYPGAWERRRFIPISWGQARRMRCSTQSGRQERSRKPRLEHNSPYGVIRRAGRRHCSPVF
jgi:hypothetical protein